MSGSAAGKALLLATWRALQEWRVGKESSHAICSLLDSILLYQAAGRK